jgi:hypothetical protein
MTKDSGTGKLGNGKKRLTLLDKLWQKHVKRGYFLKLKAFKAILETECL